MVAGSVAATGCATYPNQYGYDPYYNNGYYGQNGYYDQAPYGNNGQAGRSRLVPLPAQSAVRLPARSSLASAPGRARLPARFWAACSERR